MATNKKIILFLTVIIASVLIPGCPDSIITPEDSLTMPGRGFFMGILPVPGDGQSFEDAYCQAAQTADFSPVWGRPTPFYNLSSDLSGDWGKTFVTEYIRGNGMFPLIHLSFIGPGITLVCPPDLGTRTLSDREWREAYKKSALDVVRSIKPLFLSLGNEVNRWYENYGADPKNPDGFQHYVSLYEEIYDEVKKLSPQTFVFCTFAREIVSENREANLEVLKMFHPAKIDILVFTSYPYAVRGINRTADIPDDYYSRAFDYFASSKPFGFSELGWPSIEEYGGEKGQADFITEITGRLTRDRGLDLYLLGWAWLHDLTGDDHIGLIKRNGVQKIAYSEWQKLAGQ